MLRAVPDASGQKAGASVLARCVERLACISTYFESYQQHRAGSLECDKHYRVTHYGQLAYLLRIDGFLFQRTQNEQYLERGGRMVKRLQSQLRFDQGKYIFYPGLLNRYNASNNAIDCGVITDCLAYWYEQFADATPPAGLELIRDACAKVARTYLRFAGGKLTNQALWAMTGLAAVYRAIDADEAYRAACVECLQQAFRDQNDDGSFPYLPHRLAGEDSPSLHDVSGFYHSRHLSFIFDVADKIGYALDAEERERLRKAADFLCALYRPDGSKSLEVEAKHWYWMGGETGEWASACFDYHALSEAHRRWGEPHHLRALAHATRAFLDHGDADGSVRSRSGDRDFQCTHFWSAHCAWVAKALDASEPALPPAPSAPLSYDGEQSGIVCRQDERANLQVRSRKYPLTPLFGGYASGVTWLSVAGGGREHRNLLQRRRWSFDAPGEVFQLPLHGASTTWIRDGARRLVRYRSEYRFALALCYQNVLVRRFGQAFYLLRELLLRRSVHVLAPLYASFWSLDCQWTMDESVLTLASRMARADGSSDGGAWCEKTLALGADALRVEIRLSNGPWPSVFFVPLTPAVQDVRAEPDRIRRLRRGLVLRLPAQQRAAVCYALPYGDD